MINQVITSTPLVSDAANTLFQNINGESFNRDFSFLSTLRALVYPRMSEEDKLYLHFSSADYTADAVRRNPIRDVVRVFSREARGNENSFREDQIYIHSFKSASQEDNYACLEAMKSSFEKYNDGWHRLAKVTEFFKKDFYVLCFVNTELRSTLLFVDDMNIGKMHFLQCAIFAFLPWYFDPTVGVSELEMELINSLRKTEKTPDKYERCIEKIASQYDFRTLHIRKKLAGFENRYERIAAEGIRSDIKDIVDEINDSNTRIANLLREKYEKEIKLLGYEQKINSNESGDSEIMEYFLCNDKLIIRDVNDREMTFGVREYLTYWDEDMAEQMIENERSFVYRPNGRMCNNYILAEDMKKLMKAIFVDRTLRVRFCAAYKFELDGRVRALRNYDYTYEFADYMPNTHIDRYECMGNYSTAINTLLTNHDYIGAIEQCVASCKSLNFADSTVMAEFMRVLYGISDYQVNNRCIELPDGSVVDPKGAVAYLKAQEQAEEGSKTDE